MLENEGPNVQLVTNKWATSRDFILSFAKILLNVHYHESYNVYEEIRCDRWTFTGMMVVSEDSHDNESLDISDHKRIIEDIKKKKHVSS
jgi:hypothetical protein